MTRILPTSYAKYSNIKNELEVFGFHRFIDNGKLFGKKTLNSTYLFKGKIEGTLTFNYFLGLPNLFTAQLY